MTYGALLSFCGCHWRPATVLSLLGLVGPLLCIQPSWAAARSVQECNDLGFSESLLCTTCDRLRDFLPSGAATQKKAAAADSEKLISECNSCCKAESSQVYAKAIFYTDPFSVEVNQDIEDFVKRKADAFPNLKVKLVDGARTTIQLFREGEDEDNSNEYINAHGLKSDEIRDFISLKLGKGKKVEV